MQFVSKMVMGVSTGMILGVPVTIFLANFTLYEAAMLFPALSTVCTGVI